MPFFRKSILLAGAFFAAGIAAADNRIQVPVNDQAAIEYVQGLAASFALTVANAGAFADTEVGSTSAALRATLSNAGPGALSLAPPSGVTLQGSAFQQFATTCGGSVAAGASCAIDLKFAPTVPGAATGTLVAKARGITKSVALSGNGVTNPLAGVTLDAIDFGYVLPGAQTNLTAYVRNNGSRTVTVSAIGQLPQGSGLAASVYPGTCSGKVLAPGASCYISAQWAATDLGARSTTMQVRFGADGDLTALATGIGRGPRLTAAGEVVRHDFYDFMNTPVGSTRTTAITIANTGDQPATNLRYSLIGNNLAYGEHGVQSTTCGASLAAGASCNVVVSFTAAAAGSSGMRWIYFFDDELYPYQTLVLGVYASGQ